MITLPTMLSAVDWAGALATDLGGRVPRLEDEKSWKFWAANVLLNLGVSEPNPDQFSDWRAWAERFCQVEV